MTDKNDDFTRWLTTELDKRRLSQRELARRIGVSSTNVNDVINQRIKPSWNFCASIASEFDLSEIEVFKIAGLLPNTIQEDGITPKELWNVIQQLSINERQELLEYALFRFLKRRI